MKHTLLVLVDNQPGVLARVAGLFSRRGYNIDSLTVGPTEREDVSRMTIVVDVEEHYLEQVRKQLYKLINVREIIDVKEADAIERELVLIKVNSDAKTRPSIIEIVDIFRAKIVDVAKDNLSIEITGTESKVRALEDLLKPFGIIELVRTGVVALPRGKK